MELGDLAEGAILTPVSIVSQSRSSVQKAAKKIAEKHYGSAYTMQDFQAIEDAISSERRGIL